MTESKRGGRRHERAESDRKDAGNDRLRAILRQGDPNRDDRSPSPAERAALRRLIVDAAGSASTSGWRPLAAFAYALIAIVVLAGVLLLLFRPAANDTPPQVAGHNAADQPAADNSMAGRPPADSADAEPGPAALAETDQAGAIGSDAAPAIRNVQFITKGGTRIVWVLNRNLNI